MYLQLIISIIASLFIFTGCGGGGSGDGTTLNSPSVSDPDPLVLPIVPDEQIVKSYTLSLSSGIYKTGYLDTNTLTGQLRFSIENNTTKGTFRLLDENTGRYSYISTVSNDTDSFVYRVSNDQGESSLIQVGLNIGNSVPVRLNSNLLNDFSSNLPLVIIDTGDREIPDEPKIKGVMSIIEISADDNRSRLSIPPAYTGYMEIEIRGSSSQMYPKKQYSVDTETWDQEDDDVSLLSMPVEHKWILNAPYTDKSLMRNYLAYHKTREINESKYYAVRSQYVELLVRDGDTYRYDGVYILMEKIKRDTNRLDITKLSSDENLPPELSGGYVFKQDGDPDPDEDVFAGITGTRFIYVDPKSSKITIDQKYYIEDYVQSFEFALDASDFNDTASPNYYEKHISREDFIVHFLSREFFMDVDTWIYSEYLHKDRNKTLALSTVWDFNAGMGNNDFRLFGVFQGWAYELTKAEFQTKAMRKWIERLMSDPVFRQAVKTKWNNLRSGIWSDANLSLFIDKTQNMLTEAASRNFERWPGVLGTYVWPNREACTDNGTPVYCPTFERAVNEHLKTWLLDRAQWIDQNI